MGNNEPDTAVIVGHNAQETPLELRGLARSHSQGAFSVRMQGRNLSGARKRSEGQTNRPTDSARERAPDSAPNKPGTHERPALSGDRDRFDNSDNWP